MATVLRGDVYVDTAGDRMTGPLTLGNNVELRAERTDGVWRTLALMDASNVLRLGTTLQNLYLYTSTATYERVGGENHRLWSTNWLRTAVKTVDETVTNTTTMQDDDHLYLTLPPNTRYLFIAHVWYTSSTVADFRCAFSIPEGARAHHMELRSGAYPQRILDSTTVRIFDGYGDEVPITLIGTITMGSTSGSVHYQWAQGTAEASLTTVLAGSCLVALRLV